MLKQFILSALIASAAPISYAQFGSGIVFDPTQSAHAAQQILQANQLYTTTVETERNVIGAYNLAQKMANLPQALYTSYTQFRTSTVDHSDPAAEYIWKLNSVDERCIGRLRRCCCEPNGQHPTYRSDLRLRLFEPSRSTGHRRTRRDCRSL